MRDDSFEVEQLFCHRCGWFGPWYDAASVKCHDECCDIDVCPKCGLELSNYKKD